MGTINRPSYRNFHVDTRVREAALSKAGSEGLGVWPAPFTVSAMCVSDSVIAFAERQMRCENKRQAKLREKKGRKTNKQ